MIFQDEQGAKMSLPSLCPLKGGTYQPCQHPALKMLNIKKSRDEGGKETNNLF